MVMVVLFGVGLKLFFFIVMIKFLCLLFWDGDILEINGILLMMFDIGLNFVFFFLICEL